MLTERALHLINAEMDGELGPGEREELDAILESSADARAMKAELQKLGNLLEAAPPLDPPEGLSDRILDQLAGPERKPGFSLAGLFSSFQPATVGLGFAAGLMATVLVYEWAPGQMPTGDTARMVGTMIAGRESGSARQLDALTVEAPGINGEVTLSGSRNMLMLEFDIQSAEQAQIEVELDPAGLEFGGIALSGGASKQNSYEVSGGTLRVANQGRQAFTVFLPVSANDSAGGRQIRIGISTKGANTFSGVLRG